MRKNTKINFYRIIDDFLPEDKFQELEDLMIGHSKKFPWYFGRVVNPEDYSVVKDVNIENNRQFIHIFYDYASPRSDHYPKLAPIFDLLQPSALVRVKANLLIRTPEIVVHGYHVDFELPCMSAILYMNDNNGYTIFESGEKVESRRNRMLIFPAEHLHSGSSCTDAETRVVINFNYYETKNSPKING